MTIVTTPGANVQESWSILHSTDRDTAVQSATASASLTVLNRVTEPKCRLMHVNDALRQPEDNNWCEERENTMKQISLKRLFLATAVVALGVAGSIDWSVNDGLSLSIDRAQARVGRPATPGSVAGVARRTTRRAVVGGAAVGGAVVVAPACVRVLVNGAYVCR